MIISQASTSNIETLFHHPNTYWKKFGFYVLFQLITGTGDYSPLGDLGSREQYMKISCIL